MSATDAVEVLPGLWELTAEHPEWIEQEGGEEGWDRRVTWWTLRTSQGLLLIDPLVIDFDKLDALLEAEGRCAGIVRTIHWHQRSIPDAAARYGAAVWAMARPGHAERPPVDHGLTDRAVLWDGIQAFFLERDDEIALWLPDRGALIFGDAMLRRPDGRLSLCPESWRQPAGGRDRLRALTGDLSKLPVEHVLVSHGPSVVGDGRLSLQAATG